jgi:hypothetical protein
MNRAKAKKGFGLHFEARGHGTARRWSWKLRAKNGNILLRGGPFKKLATAYQSLDKAKELLGSKGTPVHIWK